MHLQLTSTDQYSSRFGVKSIVYGAAGVGKTRLCATVPRPIIFSAEAGLMSIRQFKLPVYEINSIADFDAAINWIERSNEARNYDTICLDSLSEIAEQVLLAESRKTADGRKAYGEMALKVITYCRRFRALPYKHVYITAKEDIFAVEDKGIALWRPMFPGKLLSKDIPYFFDLVFRLENFENPGQNQKWTALRTRATSLNACKDRSGALEEFEYPHMGQVIQKIMSAETPKVQQPQQRAA